MSGRTPPALPHAAQTRAGRERRLRRCPRDAGPGSGCTASGSIPRACGSGSWCPPSRAADRRSALRRGPVRRCARVLALQPGRAKCAAFGLAPAPGCGACCRSRARAAGCARTPRAWRRPPRSPWTRCRPCRGRWRCRTGGDAGPGKDDDALEAGHSGCLSQGIFGERKISGRMPHAIDREIEAECSVRCPSPLGEKVPEGPDEGPFTEEESRPSPVRPDDLRSRLHATALLRRWRTRP